MQTTEEEYKKMTNYTEHNKSLPTPVYPDGHVETVEEFVARGGKITICPRVKAPDEYPDDPPRRTFDSRGMYDL